MADNNLTTISGKTTSIKHQSDKINKVLVNNQSQITTITGARPLITSSDSSNSTNNNNNNHMHNNSMKKKTSFQITSVTVGSSRLSNDGGDDSADDLDESHTDDISRITDNETPSFSEDTLSRDEAVVSTVIPTSAQYGLAILPEAATTVQISTTSNHTVPSSVNITAIEEIVGSPAKSNSPRADTPNKENAPEVPPPQRSERFKVVKIESTEPFRRGRWMCMDYLDHSVNQPHNSPFFKPITDVPQTTQLNGLPQTIGPMTIAPPQTLPVVQNGNVGGAGNVVSAAAGGGATTNYQPARTVAVPKQNSPVQQQATNQQQQLVTSTVQQTQSVPPQSQSIIQQPSSNIQSTQKPPPPNQQQQPSQQQPPTVSTSTANIQQSSVSQTQTPPSHQTQQQQQQQQQQQNASAGANAPTSIGGNQQNSNVNTVVTQSQQQQTSTGGVQQTPPTSVYQYMNPPFTNMMPVITSSGLLLTQTSTSTSPPILVSSGVGGVASTGGGVPINTSQQQTNNIPQSSTITSTVSSTTTQVGGGNVPPPTSSQPYVPSSSVFNQTSMVQSPLTSVPPLTAATSVSVSTSTSIPTPTPTVSTVATGTNTQSQAPGQTYAGHPMSTQQIPVQAQSYSGQQIQHQFMPQNYQQNIVNQQVQNGSNRWPTPTRLDGVGSGDTSSTTVLTGIQPPQVANVSGASFTYPTSSSVFQVPTGTGTPVQAPIIMGGGATGGAGGAPISATTTGLTRTPSLSNIVGQQHGAGTTSIVSSMTPQQHASMLTQVQQQAAQMLMVSLSPTAGVNVEPQTLIAAINANQLIGGSMSTGSSIGSTNSDNVANVSGTSLIRTDNSNTNTVSNTGTTASTGNITDDESASATSTVAIDNKIEQAMDLVKSHLMFAVREEVEVLKEKIAELMDRINQLELENSILKANASAEVLQQLPSPCVSNQTQLSQMTAPGAGTTGTMIAASLTKTPSTAPSSSANITNVNVAAIQQIAATGANQTNSTT